MKREVQIGYSLLAVPVVLGCFFAFTGLDWDEGHHLHPDERFLTMVETALKWPGSWSEYLDETKSPLNPRNVGHSFFVYGTFPTTLVKALSILTGLEGYNEVYWVGRAFSGVCFVGSILVLYLLSMKLYRDSRIALLASFLFSCSVLPIQNAHFFTVDSTGALLILLSCYCLARARRRPSPLNFLLVGLFFGIAMATKVSTFTFAGVVTAVGAEVAWRRFRGNRSRSGKLKGVALILGLLAFSGVASFLIFRIAQPDAFSGPGFWGLIPSARWLENLAKARGLMTGEVDSPPGHQWTHRTPLLYPWSNMVLWGMGIPLGVVSWIGWCMAFWMLVRHRKTEHLIPVLWIGILFLHQGTQWVKSMRYLLPIYPLLAMLASWWLCRAWDVVVQTKLVSDRDHWELQAKRVAKGLIVAVPVATCLWAIAFMSIYLTPHTRIQATEWIFANLPPKVIIANEHWDDALPLRMRKDGKEVTFDAERLTLEWYSDESMIKLTQCLEKLDRCDYIILSSNRLYDSIPRLPMRFPMAIAYYQALFSGELGFERVSEFTSYPRIFGIEFPDQTAEEAFSVYDHPRVQIFKKTKNYSPKKTARILGNVNWDKVRRLSARQATELTEEEWSKMREGLAGKEKVPFTVSPIRPLPPKKEGNKQE